ncbi:MAG TPA: hypothetical protein VMJ31_09880, partial [Methylocystis sp.]|nr:hypothetical protein [Methylocystis sp.]
GGQAAFWLIKHSLSRFVVKCPLDARPGGVCLEYVWREALALLCAEKAAFLEGAKCGAGATVGENLTTRRHNFVAYD